MVGIVLVRIIAEDDTRKFHVVDAYVLQKRADRGHMGMDILVDDEADTDYVVATTCRELTHIIDQAIKIANPDAAELSPS